MAANYGKPKPVDPVYVLAGWYLNVRCECGRMASRRIGDIAAAHGIPGLERVGVIVERLRCSTCRRPPADLSVTERPFFVAEP